MEAARPAVKNWSVMEEVVSLLLNHQLVRLGSEPIEACPSSFRKPYM